MYTPKHFQPHELLPGLTADITWGTINPELRIKLKDELLILADEIRELLGVVCEVNDYAVGGQRRWCGLRTAECTIGAPNSYHRKGMAVDLHPHGMTAEDARARIRTAVAEDKLQHLGGVELGVSWLHVDTRPRIDGKVLWFNA